MTKGSVWWNGSNICQCTNPTPHLLVTTGVRFFQLTSFSTRASLSLGQSNSSPLVLCVTVIAVASLSGFEDGFFVSKNKAVPSNGREGKKERAHTKSARARVMPCRLSVIRRDSECRVPASCKRSSMAVRYTAEGSTLPPSLAPLLVVW